MLSKKKLKSSLWIFVREHKRNLFMTIERTYLGILDQSFSNWQQRFSVWYLFIQLILGLALLSFHLNPHQTHASWTLFSPSEFLLFKIVSHCYHQFVHCIEKRAEAITFYQLLTLSHKLFCWACVLQSIRQKVRIM